LPKNEICSPPYDKRDFSGAESKFDVKLSETPKQATGIHPFA
jgi:hypothetical protein